MGDFLILRPTDLHQFLRNDKTVCTHRDILVDGVLFEQLIDFLSPSFLENLKSKDSPFKITLDLEKIQNFESLLNSLNLQASEQTDLSTKAKCTLTNVISTVILNTKDNSTHTEMPSLVKNIISLLNTTDGIMYGIPSVTKRYKYSPIYLSRLFKKHLGFTMTDYLKNVRLKYAELYLQSTTLTLEEIAYQVGLSSTSYFNKIFKEKHGITPMKYRSHFRKTIVNAK